MSLSLFRFSSRRLTVLLLSCLSSLPAIGQQPGLSLEEALKRAEEANIELKLSRELAVQAAGAAQQQRVGLMPTVGLSGEQRRSASVSIAGDTAVRGAAVNRFDASLSGSIDLVNPRQISAYKAARRGAQVAELDAETARQDSLAGVSQAFFTQLRNERRLAVLDSNIERARSLLELSRNQAAAGVATQIDVTRAESQLALAEQARLQHGTTLVESQLTLQRLLDLPVDAPLSLSSTNLKREAVSGGKDLQLQTLRERRPDFRRATAAVDQARLELRSARWQRLPNLQLTGEYGRVAPRIGDSGSKDSWLAMASVQVPIFDGLKASADTRIALSKQRAQELRLQELTRRIDAELKLARQDSDSRDAQITVAQTSLRLAEEELRLARIRFEQGVADNREVVEAQNRLAVAADGLVEAEYQYNLSRVELARVQGEVREILREIE